MATKIEAQDLEISSLKARVKILEYKDSEREEPAQEDAPIKGKSIKIGEEVVVERSTELGNGLDRSNEVIAKHLQEYKQSEAELSIREKIELINELVKYQDHYAKILKYQAQQSKPLSKKEQR
nr:hypothetical protein [Tanacetum cinerariifolium]